MRPILEQQIFISTVNLKGTVDGTTENMKFRGVEIKNIVNDERRTVDIDTTNNDKKTIKIDTDLLEDGQEYTVMFKVMKNSASQGQFDQIRVVIGVLNTPQNLSVQMPLGIATGQFKKKFLYSERLLTEPNKNNVKLVIHGIPAKLTVTDIMIVKGNWEHTEIPYFWDKKGFGPDITVISHNKNIVSSFKLADKLYPGASNQITNNNALKILNFYTDKLEKDTNYTVSFKRHENKNVTKQFFIYGSNSEPTNGVQYTQIISNPAETSLKFNTGKYKYISVYLGFVFNKDDIKDIAYDIQIEAGDKATPYVPPGFSHKTYNIKHELFAGDVLEYDKDYNKWVINHIEKHQDRPDTITTKWITDIVDPYTYTFNNETWIAVRDQDNILQGSIEFDYFKDPLYIPQGLDIKYRILIVLNSGDVIQTSEYTTVQSNPTDDAIHLIGGYHGCPDRRIEKDKISKIIHIY